MKQLKKGNSQKILMMAGSHAATTAAAVVEEIKLQKLPWKMFWIGKKWSGEDRKSFSLEYKILPDNNIEFMPVDSGKIENKLTRNTFKALLKIPFGFIHTGSKLVKIKPDLILSFGGATGAQTALWGILMGIPVIIHEQTSAAGRANIKSVKFATKIAISRESSVKYFPKNKTILTGNPISREIVKLVKNKARNEILTIMVTGGSRGSKWINDSIEPLVSKLGEKYKIIWQCGEENYQRLKAKYKNVEIFGQVEPKEYAKYLAKADVVIGRAGSNTISELVALKKPSILIPIPWSYLDEQTKNAEFIKELGLARIIKQSELTPQRLYKEIKRLVLDYPLIIKNTKGVKSLDIQASKKLLELVKVYI